MLIAGIVLAIAFIVVLAVLLLRRAGGGRFPWLQFYMKGRELAFTFHEIHLLRRVSIESRLENPTALFWSTKQLDRAIKGIIITYRARSKETSPEYNILLSKLFELRKRVEFDQPKYKMGIKSSRRLMAKQGLRIMLPGLGPFYSIVIENLPRYMAIAHPRGPKLPDGFSWKNQKIGVYLWRAEDAGYFFQTKVLDDFLDRQYPILHVAHSDNLVRTQKRTSLRVETEIPAELFPLKSIDNSSEVPEEERGLRCRLSDLSEGGAAILIRGKARVGVPLKLQVTLGDSLVIMSGVVKGITYDEKKNLSLLHMQASAPSVIMRNRILTYVYNLFGDRETNGAVKKSEGPPREGGSEGTMPKATPPLSQQGPQAAPRSATGTNGS